MCKLEKENFSKRKLRSRQIDRDKRTLTRYDQQRNRDAEMLRTVADNLQRAFYTNDSIGSDMKRETEKLKKEEDAIRVILLLCQTIVSFPFVSVHHGSDSSTSSRRIDHDQYAG